MALKVMRRGIASRSALRRFGYQAQLLGRLRHPGVAQIYEAGRMTMEPVRSRSSPRPESNSSAYYSLPTCPLLSNGKS